MHILLVEDDQILGDAIRQGLMQDHHTVEWITSGSTAERLLKDHEFDLVLLDLNLPHISGIDILHNLRRKGDVVPILILTARDTIKDRVTGLDMGADDYLVKPFDMDELSARVRALSRRRRDHASPIIRHGDIALDPRGHIVKKNSLPVDLSPREFLVLKLLLENSGKVLARSRLEEALYGWSGEIESNAVEVYVHNLRKKLGKNLIKTVRGVGYSIEKT